MRKFIAGLAFVVGLGLPGCGKFVDPVVSPLMDPIIKCCKENETPYTMRWQREEAKRQALQNSRTNQTGDYNLIP